MPRLRLNTAEGNSHALPALNPCSLSDLNSGHLRSDRPSFLDQRVSPPYTLGKCQNQVVMVYAHGSAILEESAFVGMVRSILDPLQSLPEFRALGPPRHGQPTHVANCCTGIGRKS